MKRTIALAVFIAALGIFVKLAKKPAVLGTRASHASFDAVHAAANAVDARSDPKSALMAKYATEPLAARDLVARVADRFGRTAQEVERTDGLKGLVLLDRLDLEAIFLYEKHPVEFHRLGAFLGTDAAADILLHWREYFGLKRADDTDRRILISEVARLTPAQQRIAARYPSVLPLILAQPAGVAQLVERLAGDERTLADTVAVLSFVSLEQGSTDLRSALRTINDHGPLALEAFRLHGPEGFALVALYGPILEAVGSALPLNQSLILVRVNADDIDDLSKTHRPETVAGYLRHVAAAGLTEAVGGSPHALRLTVEFGAPGERALKKAGPDAADVVYADFADATLRRRAVEALATHGSMALAILDKYATDPDFREILQTRGAAIIPSIAQADAGPETLAYLGAKTHRSFTESLALAALFASGDNGQATIRTIKNDGLERVAQLNNAELRYYQFLPLYDVIHLGNVMSRGYSPTASEMTWALVDGCFVVADALSLAAIQPEGAIAVESVRAEAKAAVRAGARKASRELVETAVAPAGKAVARREMASALGRAGPASVAGRWARWWTVRSAGGMYQVLRQLPEVVPRLSLEQLTEIARPLAARAGMRLTAWKPIRLLRNGTEVVLRIPPERGLKYLAAQAVQASVGVVGFRKMEEHLAARRAHPE